MPELPRQDEIELTVAALRLRKNYQATRTLMFQGELQGRRIGTRWYVALADVERLEKDAPHRPDRVAALA